MSVTPEMIDCWRANYGLDARTPADALRYWNERHAGIAPAGAVAALGLCIEEIERLRADRRVLQADGAHPAPCARYCEAQAFEIEGRRLAAAARCLAKDLSILKARCERLSVMLTTAREQFRRYADLHYAKGTDDGKEKGMVNANLARLCDIALSSDQDMRT